MKKGKKYLIPVFILLFSINGCHDLIEEEVEESSIHQHVDSSSYPTRIFALSPDELKQLQDEFNVRNNNQIDARLNKYGFINNEGSIITPSIPKRKLSREEILNIITGTLIYNRKFTNIRNEQEALACMQRFDDIGNGCWWLVEFRNQKCEGLEVVNTDIAIYAYSDRVYCILNSFYPAANIPAIDNVSAVEAAKKVVGYSINIIGGYGAKFIVTDNSVGEINTKAIFPFEKENVIELRVVWKIPILNHNHIDWYLYLDSTTGEIVGIKQIPIIN